MYGAHLSVIHLMEAQRSLLADYLREIAVIQSRMVDNLVDLWEHGERGGGGGLQHRMVHLLH